MDLSLLAGLHARLIAASGHGLAITPDLLGVPELSASWRLCLNLSNQTVVLSGDVNVSQVNPAGWFSVSGNLTLLGCPARLLDIYFFLSLDANGDPASIESLIPLGALPNGWNATEGYPALPAYASYDSGEPMLVDSFFSSMPITGTLAYSSYDFVGASLSCASAGATMPADVIPLAKIQSGVTISGTVATSGAVWNDLRALLHLDDCLAISGVVGQRLADDAPTITIAYASDATLAIPGLSNVSVQLRNVKFVSGLTREDNVSPRIEVLMRIAAHSVALDFVLTLDIGSGAGDIHAALDTPVDISADWLASFKLSGFLSVLEADVLNGLDPLKTFGSLALTAAQARFSVAPPQIANMTITVEPARPWLLIADSVAVLPRFTFGTTQGADGQTGYIGVEAVWYLGQSDETPGCVLDVVARSDTHEVYVTLKQGEAFDTDGFIGEIFPDAPAVLRDIQLIDFELEGNFAQQSFALRVEAGATWDHSMHNATISFTDVAISASYYDVAGFVAKVEAILELGGCAVDVCASFDNGEFELSASIAHIDIADLVDDVMQAIDLPEEMPSFKIDNLVVLARPQEKHFEFHAQCAANVHLFDGFSFVVEQVDVIRDASAGSVSATMQMSLLLRSTTVMFESTYDSAAGWTFQATSGKPHDLGALIDGLEQLLKIDYPLPRDKLGIANLAATLVLAKSAAPAADGVDAAPTRQFVATCDVVDLTTSESYGSLTFLAERAGSGWDYIVVTALARSVDTSSLPLVGHDLGKLVQLDGVALLVASRLFTAVEVDSLVQLLPGATSPLTSGQIAQLQQGMLLTAILTVGQDATPVQLALGSSSSTGSETRDVAGVDLRPFSPRRSSSNAAAVPGSVAPASPANASNTKWFDVHQGFGALTIDRLGFRYTDGVLYLLFDADMAIGPMQMSLEGLGLGSSLGHLDIQPNLDGLGVSLTAGPLDFAGAFMRARSVAGTSYEGILQLGAGEVSLALLGRYTDTNPPSFFVFGLLDAPPLGGPPYFFVEALALGLGYNNTLLVPSLDKVPQFPIVQAVLPGMLPFGTNPTPDSVLQDLQGTGAVTDTRGEMWLAAGVRFSSFELVDSFALVTAEFGARLEFSLIGMSQASIPPDTDDTPIAFAQVAIEATCDPEHGVLQVAGALTSNSFVLSRACHLTGGYAFSTWFKTIDTPGGQISAGDFVYTLGGYHPAYAVPAHYPSVPRLGLFWQVDDKLTVQGGAYFALTPYCVMAGCSVSAVWTSSGLRAWFDLVADFLMSWKPFFYSADVGFSIGVSYRLNLLFTTVTMSVEVDVSISLQGPEFGGSATIDLSIFSITISFGADSEPKTVDWPQFRASFLPAPEASASSAGDAIERGIFKASAQAGLFRDLSRTASADQPSWVFKGESLKIVLSSPIPFTVLDASPSRPTNLPLSDSGWPQGLGITPMQVRAGEFVSAGAILLERWLNDSWQRYSAVTAVALERSVPASLWSPVGEVQPSSPQASAPLISAITGFAVSQKENEPDATCDVAIANLRYEKHSAPVPIHWAPVSAPTSDAFNANAAGDQLVFTAGGDHLSCTNYILSDIARPADARQAMIAAMNALGMAVNAEVDLDLFATATVLDDWPRIRKLGET